MHINISINIPLNYYVLIIEIISFKSYYAIFMADSNMIK